MHNKHTNRSSTRSRLKRAHRTLTRLVKASHEKQTVSSDASYRAKAQIARFKRSIGKLKGDLKEAQSLNEQLTNELYAARSCIENASKAYNQLLEIRDSLDDTLHDLSAHLNIDDTQ